MKEENEVRLKAALKGVEDGTFEIRRRYADACGTPLTEQFTVKSNGRGIIETFPLYPGIEISLHRYTAEKVRFHHRPKSAVLEINHCRYGRIGWNMRNGEAVYLGAGDSCLHSMTSCADSEMTLPLGYYEGIALTADLRELKKSCPEILREAGFDAQQIYLKLCAPAKPLAIPSSSTFNHVFAPLYDLPEALRAPYYKLKAQEILLCLTKLQPNEKKELVRYGTRQTELIKEIRGFLTENVDKRYTIEELAKKYLLNTSTLKSVFKAVYGIPIAAYMKEYRIRQAEKLLLESSGSIAEIAEKVGYETQGKFTKAFKEKNGLLPTEYRKLYKK